MLGSVGLLLALSGGAHAITTTCAGLNGRSFTSSEANTVTDANPGDVFTVNVPAGTIVTVTPPGTTLAGPGTVNVVVPSSHPSSTPFSFSIAFDSGSGPVTVTTACGTGSSTGISRLTIDAFTQIGVSISMLNQVQLVDQQLRDRLHLVQTVNVDPQNPAAHLAALRREAELIVRELDRVSEQLLNELQKLTPQYLASLDLAEQYRLSARIFELYAFRFAALDGLAEINRLLQAAGQPPVQAPRYFAPLESPSAVRRFSDAPGSPWHDAAFAGALGYAGLPAKAPTSGAGRLPAFATDPRAPWSVWASGVLTTFDRGGAAPMDGHVGNVMGGVDYRLTDRLIIGGGLGYEEQRFDTSFNAGNFRGRGPTIGPYAGYRLTPNLIANVFAGAAFLNYDVAAGGATGSYEARRLFVSGSLIGAWYYGLWRFSPRANLLYFSERRDGFTESTGTAQPGATVNVGRLSIGPEIGRRFLAFDGRGLVEPTGFFALDCDLTSRAGIVAANGVVVTQSACGGRVGGGLNVAAPRQGLSASVGVSYNSLFRADENSWTFQGSIGMRF